MAEPRKPKVHVVILNWNGWRDTVECLRSLESLTYPDSEIIVVDNGSADDSVERLREQFESLRLVETGENLGFAGGNNVAIRMALDEGADYVWLLNNDTTVEPDALTALVDACEAAEKAGAAGSKITYYDRPNVLWYAGGEFTEAGPVRHRGLDEVDTGRYEHIEPTGFITGCSLLLAAETLGQVGLMAEEYFLYWEEADLDWRIHEAGYDLLYVPGSVVRHKVAGSLGQSWSTKQTTYLVRNMLLFFSRNDRRRLPRIVRSAIGDGLGHFAHARFGMGKATFAGLWMYYRGRFGKIG